MSKNRKRVIGFLLAVVLLIPMSTGISALLSDRAESQVNTFKPGFLDTGVSESYTPITVSLSNLNNKYVSKTVRFQNKGNVPCYLRASVEFSNSDFNAGLQNTSNSGNAVTLVGGDWVKESDGWYYYKKLLQPGEYTSVLFDRVSFGTLNTKYLKNVNSFEIYVFEESVSNFHNGSTFSTYSSAWNLHKNVR